MKVLLVNGSPHPHGCTDVALSEVAMQLGKHGIETEMLWLGNEAIHGCIACIFDDEVNRVAAKAEEYDGIVVGSPVYYGGPDSQICAFLDRLFYSAGKKFVRKPAAAVVSCRRGGATASFERLNKYFEMSNMPLVTSQYWNQIHGNNAEEAKQDAEGLQTMRTLAENMAWLLKCIEAGKKAGVEEPVYEPFHATNFIR